VLSNCGYFLKNCIVRPTKIATFRATKGNQFCVTHNDCRRQPLIFKLVKTFLAPIYFTASPNAWSGSATDLCLVHQELLRIGVAVYCNC